jgi:hypothetical protein
VRITGKKSPSQELVRYDAASTAAPTFLLRLRAAPGRDPVHALRALLKFAWRRLGLRAISVREEQPTTIRYPELSGASLDADPSPAPGGHHRG